MTSQRHVDEAERSTPAVVVARRPVAGREAEFGTWLWTLTLAASQADGYVDSTIQPPDPVHPDEWVIVYRFASVAGLQTWLDSDTRRALIADGADLVDASREHVMLVADRPDIATGVTSFVVAPGREDDFDAVQRELDIAAAAAPGFLRVERFAPVHGEQRETVIVFSFDSAAHLNDWLSSDVRRELIARADAFVEGERKVSVVGGFAGWFERPGTGVTRWKQASIVVLGLVPTSLLLNALRIELVPDLAWPVATVILNVIGVTLLTWVIMPVLTRVFSGWLRR